MLNHDHLGSSGLPGRWANREHFVVLETGFGAGNGFLKTWAAWRADPRRCRTLHYIAIDAHPPEAVELRHAFRDGESAALATRLFDSWPALTPNLHRLEFEDGRVQLLLVVDDLRNGLRELVAEVDAFFFEEPPSAPQGVVWQPRLCKRLARLAAPDATLSSRSSDAQFAEGLRAAGFAVTATPAGANTAATTIGRFAPGFIPSRPPARHPVSSSTRGTTEGAARRHALILGAGLAGCATASALADQGWAVTLVDRHPTPAAEASGNAAGVFHGVVHAHDGHHARFNRAAALEAGRIYRQMLAATPNTDTDVATDVVAGSASGSVGSVDGLLRLGSKLVDLASMEIVLAELRLPAGFVQAVGATQASKLAGIPLADAAWLYPTGGWMRPTWLATTWLERASDACTFIGGVEVDSIRKIDDEWAVLDRQGKTIASSTKLVLANAGGAQHLLDGLTGRTIDWPLQQVRGQSSRVALRAGLGAPPLMPLSGAGYVLPAIDGCMEFGATAQPNDDCPAVRASDHHENAARLARLSPSFDTVQGLPPGGFDGRTAWRCVSADRLPLLGAVPHAWAGGGGGDWDQPRFVPRRPGLYLFTALGSRGITWTPLGAAVLAAMMTGAPIPLEASLVDAIDPARFLSRANRRKAAADQAGTG